KGPEWLEDRAWWMEAFRGASTFQFGGYSDVRTPALHTSFRIGAGQLERIRQVLRQHKVTLFNFLMSTLQVLLKRFRGQQDTIVASPAANRTDPRYADTVGYFANVLLYRQQLADGLTWEELWDRNRESIATTMDHQAAPVGHLRELPQTDVLFQFQQYRRAVWVAPPRHVEPLGVTSVGFTDSPLGVRENLWVELPQSGYPIVLEALERPDSVEVMLRYRVSHFRTPWIEVPGVVKSLLELIAGATANPAAPVT
ncbi:MAG: condensation domain-containing protein, partial [Candidatus Xenobia bacterium]